ncbi:DUF1566 domain-containing protein [Methylomonas sp. SURF-1]|uniref:DUF1566 domain-containing protein n=1 Tax=Methylomonas aurea TaxID=2952224 RepID=A0ABT1UJ94_9GAMM|nr:DUF1566 domain-containing protein [Methylomonas sp. SURF-1]
MSPKSICLCLATIAITAASGAQAQLFDRGGGLIYDSALNVTWLADANYAKTSGFDADGKMSWPHAMAWVAGLSYYDSLRGVSYDDWRLPRVTDLGQVGCDYAYSGSDCGYNVATTSSELAHLFYGDFANKAFADSRGLQQPGYGLVDDPADSDDESLFRNIESYYYWTATPYQGGAGNSQDSVWYLHTATGMQNYSSKGLQSYVWAVRDGDVAAVPDPDSYILFLSGLGLVFWQLRRRNAIASLKFFNHSARKIL